MLDAIPCTENLMRCETQGQNQEHASEPRAGYCTSTGPLQELAIHMHGAWDKQSSFRLAPGLHQRHMLQSSHWFQQQLFLKIPGSSREKNSCNPWQLHCGSSFQQHTHTSWHMPCIQRPPGAAGWLKKKVPEPAIKGTNCMVIITKNMPVNLFIAQTRQIHSHNNKRFTSTTWLLSAHAGLLYVFAW